MMEEVVGAQKCQLRSSEWLDPEFGQPCCTLNTLRTKQRRCLKISQMMVNGGGVELAWDSKMEIWKRKSKFEATKRSAKVDDSRAKPLSTLDRIADVDMVISCILGDKNTSMAS